ncbi:uncharacterized protein LOC111859494 isoform X1 [Tachysurus ichikawai]
MSISITHKLGTILCPRFKSLKMFQAEERNAVEVELLLRVTQEYKVAKASENVDWETCQNKYSEILDRFKEQYPADDVDYPHSKDEVTKLTLTTKLKAIRLKYRHVVDYGKRSGHGRVVLLYFELCEQIWGGSPAITTINCGNETSDKTEAAPPAIKVVHRQSVSLDSPSLLCSSATASEDSDGMFTETQNRRDRLKATLSNRQGRLKRKLSNEGQLITLAQEVLKLWRQTFERMEAANSFQRTVRLTSNIEKLTNSVTD